MKKKNLSQYTPIANADNSQYKIGIVVSEWNDNVTNALKEGTIDTLKKEGVSQIIVHSVPGSFELPSAAAMLLDSDEGIDAVICIGCVIQGDTRHFDFICDAVANGVMRVSLDYGAPVIFGVLTCNTMEQAIERAGGTHGNKGVEAAATCLKMIQLQRKLN
jgi:6,7-dimethyl-8-ribityllumazine synthase